MKEANLRALQL